MSARHLYRGRNADLLFVDVDLLLRLDGLRHVRIGYGTEQPSAFAPLGLQLNRFRFQSGFNGFRLLLQFSYALRLFFSLNFQSFDIGGRDVYKRQIVHFFL